MAMRMLMRTTATMRMSRAARRLALLLLPLLLTLSAACGGQGITYNQVITWGGQPSTTATGPSDTIRDVNQTAAWVSVCLNSPANAAAAELEGSYDKANWFQISGQITVGTSSTYGSTCATGQAGGYYPFTRLHVLQLGGSTGTPTVTANYSASFTPIPSQGLPRYGSEPQAVTVLPTSGTWSSSDVISVGQEINTGKAVSIASISATNPNTVPVYVIVMPSSNQSPPAPNGDSVVFMLPASSTESISYSVPIQVKSLSTGVYIACSTSLASLTAPTTGCVVFTSFVIPAAINSDVNASGTILNQFPGSVPGAPGGGD